MNENNFDYENAPVTVSRRELFRQSGIAALVAAPAVGALLPSEARAQLFGKPSVDQQKQLGREAAQQTLQKYREVRDSRATHFREIGAKLISGLSPEDQRKWDYTFRVLESDEVNAFALPGGPMFLFTGLYKLMNTDDQVAAVTGHELGHVRMEHWAKASAKAQERQVGLAIGLSIFKVGRAGQTVAGLANSIIGLKYSRSEEDEADEKGLANLVSAGFSPQGMVDLFQTLNKVSGGGGKGGFGGEVLSDHPQTSTRIRKTQERIAAYTARGLQFPQPTPFSYQRLLS